MKREEEKEEQRKQLEQAREQKRLDKQQKKISKNQTLLTPQKQSDKSQVQLENPEIQKTLPTLVQTDVASNESKASPSDFLLPASTSQTKQVEMKSRDLKSASEAVKQTKIVPAPPTTVVADEKP